MENQRFGDVALRLAQYIGEVEICRPPNNFFDTTLIEDIAQAMEQLDADPACRVIVLSAQGKNFCAGGKLSVELEAEDSPLAGRGQDNPLYLAAVRLFQIKKPIIAQVQGAAIGGGLGLSLVADFRVAGPRARFGANFVHLGIHPGFGISHSLPRIVGQQKAHWMLLTGRRIKPAQALAWGLADEIVAEDELLAETTMSLAKELAQAAPLALQSTRATQRRDLAAAILQMSRHEFAEQRYLARTADFAEGLQAVSERRPGVFKGE